MSLSRRQFILSTAGAAVGAIIPAYYYRALEFLEQFGKPHLELPNRFHEDLCVLDNYGELELYLGDPFQEPPVMTWREYVDYAGYDSLERFLEDREMSPENLDEEVDPEFLWDGWFMRDGPGPAASDLLQSLDLGSTLTGKNAVGGLEFFENSNMVHMWRGVRAVDEVSLSLLQKRLNDLDTGIRIVTGYSV
jgi:hypothetical protein